MTNKTLWARAPLNGKWDPFVTPGARYRVEKEIEPGNFTFLDDEGDPRYSSWKNSHHAGGADWIREEEPALDLSKPLQTRDGRRVLCVAEHDGVYYGAIVHNTTGKASFWVWDGQGRGGNDGMDLVNVPDPERVEIRLFRDSEGMMRATDCIYNRTPGGDTLTLERAPNGRWRIVE